MPEVPINIEPFGSMDTYLVETTSVSGMIAAPVFVHVGPMRLVNHRKTIIQQAEPFKRMCYFLGLMHGPWRTGNNDVNVVRGNGSGDQINQGIAVIVPASKIMEIISRREWVRARLAIVNEEHNKRLAVQAHPFAMPDTLQGTENKSS